MDPSNSLTGSRPDFLSTQSRRLCKLPFLLVFLLLAACGGGSGSDEQEATGGGDDDIPVVTSVLRTDAPDNIPDGLIAICNFSPTEGLNPECPVLTYMDYTYWAYSYTDNRFSLAVVAYDSSGTVVGQWVYTNTRYIWQITVEPEDSTVTFYGDDFAGGGVDVVSWDDLIPDGLPITDVLQANAGEDQYVAPSDTVTLDGSGSSAPDSTTLDYAWSLTTIPTGSTATLSDATTDAGSFVADIPGTYIAQLQVSDDAGGSDTATVTITAGFEPVIGTALASDPPANIPAGMRVTCVLGPDEFTPSTQCPVLRFNDLTYWAYSYTDNRSAFGIVAYDDDGEIVEQWERAGARYLWEINVDREANIVTFSGQSSAMVAMTWAELTPAPVPGEDTLLADAGSDQFVSPGGVVNLDGTDSIGPIAATLDYTWSLTAIPAGSSAVLSNANTANATFVADVAGEYNAELVVSDGTANSSTATVTIIANDEPVVESAPTANPPGNIPEGMRVSCNLGPDTFTQNPMCPVLRFNGYTYWAYSYRDNRSSFGIVAYDDAGEIVTQWEATGARYMWQITVDSTAETVTFFGQANRTATLTWAELTP